MLSPLRRVCWLRILASPALSGLVVGSIALLTAAVCAPLLFERAASQAALREELKAVETDAFASTSSGVRASLTGVLTDTARTTVLRTLDRLPSLGTPFVTARGTAGSSGRGRIVPVVARGEQVAKATLYYHDGAIRALSGASTTPPGVWLDREVAHSLGARPGDEVAVGLDNVAADGPGSRAPVKLVGVFDRSAGSALPAAVAEGDPVAARRDLPWDPDHPGRGTPLILADQATFDRLALVIGELPQWTADLELDQSLSAADATSAATAVKRLADRAFEDMSNIAQATNAAKPEPTRLQLASGLPDIVARASDTTSAAKDQASGFSGAGVILGSAVVCAAVGLLGMSRRREQELMAGLGMRPREVASLSAAEWLIPTLVGAVVGAAVAWATVARVGPPGDFGDGVVSEVALRAVAAAALGLALVIVFAWLGAWWRDRRLAGQAGASGQSVPWETSVVVATVVCAVAVGSSSARDRPSDPLAVVLPVLVSVTVAIGVLRLLQTARSRTSMTWGTSGSPIWLALRRARVGTRETTAVALMVSVGLSLLGYALAVQRGVTEGVDDKVAASVGARTVVDVGGQLAHRRGPPRLPRPPFADTTVVWRQQVTLPPSFGTEPLLAIDRRSFAAVADWGSTGALHETRDLLDDLGRHDDRPLLPVVVAGDGHAKGDVGELNAWDDWSIGYQVVGVVDAFPGSWSTTGNIAILADAALLFSMVPAFDPTVSRGPPDLRTDGIYAGAFSAEIWSSEESAAVASSLERQKLTAGEVRRREEAATSSFLLAARWSSGYVLALGAAAVLLVTGTALLLGIRFADRDRVSDVLLRRAGFSPRELTTARMWEVAGVIGSALVAASAAVLVLTAAPTMIDPDVSMPPLAHPVPGVSDFTVLAAISAAMLLAATLVARRRSATARPAEVLRGND